MIRPEVGSIIRLISRSVVLLPQPDGPTSTRISPFGMLRSRSATAGMSEPGYTLPTPWRWIIGAGASSFIAAVAWGEYEELSVTLMSAVLSTS